MKAAPSNESQRSGAARSHAAGKGSPEYTALAAFGVAVLALLLVGILSIRSLLQVGEQSSLVEHSYQVIRQAERMLANILDIQSGQRGYIITGSEEYLANYDAARVAVQQDVQRLRSLTADNPAQRHYLDEMEKLVTLRLAIAHERIELRRAQNIRAAQAAVAAGEGKAVTDKIRSAQKNIVAEEQRLLAERNQLEKNRTKITLVSIASLGGLAIVILGLAGARIRRISAEQRLTAHERDRLFNYALDMYSIAGFDGYFKQINPAWEKTLGWSKAELLDRPYLEFIHPDDLEITAHAAATAREGKELYVFENRYRCKDGSYKWLSWVAYPQIEEGLIFAVARDITESKRAGIQLQETLELQRAILDNAGYAVISTTPDGIITTFNPAAEKILGYAAAEVVGLRTPAIIHDPAEVAARAKEFSDELGEAIAPGFDVFVAKARRNLPNEYEWTYIRKDGTRFPVLLSVTALRDAAGAITGFLGMAADISRRKRNETLIRQLSRAVEQSPVSIVIANLAAEIEYVNPKFTEVTGYTLAEVLGRNPRMWKSGDKGPEEYSELWQTLTAGKEWRGEFRNKKKNGEIYWESASISPIRDAAGIITHYVAVNEDITERKHIEQLILEKNEELKRFTYTVSHDLKAPLRGIAGYAQELEHRHKEGLPERAQFCIAQIITASRNLDNLIEDLLKYSRLDTEALTLTEVNLPGLVQGILRDRSLEITERGIEVSVNVPPVILRSWERGLQQILANLIDNAIKYSRQSKPPRLTINAETAGDVCGITVTDNGIGFDMKYHDRIFGLFNRLVRADEFEGTGVGLAIVKKLVEKLGGSIRAESAPGQGATFFVELPISSAGESAL